MPKPVPRKVGVFPERFKPVVRGEKRILPERIHVDRGIHWKKILYEEKKVGHTLALQKEMELIRKRFDREATHSPETVHHYSNAYLELASRVADETSVRLREVGMQPDWNELFAGFLYVNRLKIPAPVRALMRREIFSNIRTLHPKKTPTPKKP